MMERLYNSLPSDLLAKFQIIPSRVRDLDPDRKKVLWLHDLPTDPEASHLKNGGWEVYDAIVFVSSWQQQMFNTILGVPYSSGTIIQNGIIPIEEHDKSIENDEPIRLMYFSTPHRGLDVAFLAFQELAKHHNIVFDVFSSFDLYGWGERDNQHRELIDELKAHPKVNYSKSVSNEVIREKLKTSHILAYPSTWPETSCLCLIEAMSAGLVCVHSNLGALPETSMGRTAMYGYTEDKARHINDFTHLMDNVLTTLRENPQKVAPHTKLAKLCADDLYNWTLIQQRWKNLLTSLL